jgi:hypothetical protein
MKLLDAVFEAVVDISEIVKMTRDEFIEKAKKVHGDKYNYDNVNYVGSKTPVEIICHKEDKNGNEHGPFLQIPNSHLSGKGCQECRKENMRVLRLSNTDEFIGKAKKIHGDKYDYKNVNYVGNKTPVEVICHNKDENDKEHGPWMTTPNLHLTGSGCRKCGWETGSGHNLSNTEEFIEKAKKVHGDKYDYDNVKYTKSDEDVIIVCHRKDKNNKEHGPFLQMPHNHLKGTGCPRCNNSKGENKIEQLLKQQGIYYIDQYKNEYCYSFKGKNKNRKCTLLKFDFYLPKLKIMIEYDGLYHFKKYHTNTDEGFMSDVLHDREKNSFTKLKGIKLIRISYLDMNNIEEELINGFKSKEQLYLSTNYETDKGWADNGFQPSLEFTKKYT